MSNDNIILLGAGQVGTSVASELTKIGYNVHAGDIKPDEGFFFRYGPAPNKASINQVDICNLESLKGFMKSVPNCRTVVLSFGLSGNQCIKNPLDSQKTYIDGIGNTLKVIKLLNIPKLIFISSLGVYSNSNKYSSFVENQIIDPNSKYGEIIYQAEQILRITKHCQRIIIRSAGIYGPKRFGFGSHSAIFFERLLYAAHYGNEVTIAGYKNDSDDYIYIKDVGRCIATAVNTQIISDFEIFNLGTGQVSTLEQILEIVDRWFPKANIQINKPQHRSAIKRIPMNIEKIRNKLGYEPYFNISNGLNDYYLLTGLGKKTIS